MKGISLPSCCSRLSFSLSAMMSLSRISIRANELDSVFYLNVDVGKCAKFVIREGKIIELERTVNHTEWVLTAKRINDSQTLEANFTGEKPFRIFDNNDVETKKRSGNFQIPTCMSDGLKMCGTSTIACPKSVLTGST